MTATFAPAFSASTNRCADLQDDMGVLDGIRTLLKVRVARKRGERGPKPRLGAKICHGDDRISVQSGLTDDMWSWLQEQGWREVTHRPDRRQYRDVPPSLVTKLFDAVPTDRLAVLKEAIAAAATKPSIQTGRRA